MSTTAAPDQTAISRARTELDAWVRELMQWHFNPDTGCPFWIEWAAAPAGIRGASVQSYDDLDKFGEFQDEWLRGGPVRRWVPRAYRDRPIYTFETGGSTGVPKSRINIDDFRIDYEMFSRTLPDEYFPKGADWLQVGPSGPRRLRLAIEHLAQHRGGICFRRRPRPALGHQVDQVGRDGDGRRLQAPRHRSGAHPHQGARRDPVSLRHAQAARSAVRTHLAEEGRHHRRLLRRHRDDAAVPPLRRRGTDGGRVLRADLRQHADGARDAQAAWTPTTTGRSSTTRRRRAP